MDCTWLPHRRLSLLIGFTPPVVIELVETSIIANCAAPGLDEMPLTRDHHAAETRESYRRTEPMGRYRMPSEIAGTMAFPCSARCFMCHAPDAGR